MSKEKNLKPYWGDEMKEKVKYDLVFTGEERKLEAAKCLRTYLETDEVIDWDHEFRIEDTCAKCNLKHFCFEEIKKLMRIEV